MMTKIIRNIMYHLIRIYEIMHVINIYSLYILVICGLDPIGFQMKIMDM